MKRMIAVLMVLLGISEIVVAADWKFLGGNDDNLFFYDAQSVTYPSKNIVRVWERSNYTEKGVADLIRTLERQSDIPVDLIRKLERLSKEQGIEFKSKVLEQLKDLSYEMSFGEIDCVEKKYRRLSSIWYDKEGNTIISFDEPLNWKFIPPGTALEALCQKVCK